MNVMTKLSQMVAKTRSATAEVHEGLESVRVRIIALKDQRAHMEVLPVPKALAIERLDQFVAFLSERSDRLISPNTFMQREEYRPPAVSSSHYHAGDLALGFVLQLMRERLASGIEAKYAPGDGPTVEEHRRMLAKLDAEILDLELVEESLVRAAEAAGIETLRRGDADPRAVLASNEALPS